jgi:hypothetical protein
MLHLIKTVDDNVLFLREIILYVSCKVDLHWANSQYKVLSKFNNSTEDEAQKQTQPPCYMLNL